MSVDVPFGQRLSEALDARQYSTRDLVEALAGMGIKVDRRTVFRWKAGESAPGIEILPAICRALMVTADSLLGMDAVPQ